MAADGNKTPVGKTTIGQASTILRMPIMGRIIVVQADHMTARECYAASLRISKRTKGVEPTTQLVAYTDLNNLRDTKLDPREE